jgi:hypothetical protein
MFCRSAVGSIKCRRVTPTRRLSHHQRSFVTRSRPVDNPFQRWEQANPIGQHPVGALRELGHVEDVGGADGDVDFVRADLFVLEELGFGGRGGRRAKFARRNAIGCTSDDRRSDGYFLSVVGTYL